MSTVAPLRAHPSRGILRVVPGPANRSWGILEARFRPVACGSCRRHGKRLANAQGAAPNSKAFPTPPWTALRAAHKAPQAKPTLTSLTEERMILTGRTAKEVGS